MAVKHFTLPDLGEGLDAAEIVEWHVAPGDRVVTDQPLVSVETDKAVVDIPAPWAGTVTRLCAEIGTTLKVGAPLVEFELGARKDLGAVVGKLESDDSEDAPAAAAPPAAPPRSAATAPRAMPAARALAARKGLDLATLTGSGPGGTITLADVERQAAATPATTAAQMTPLSAPRRAMARNMARSGAQVVAATLQDLADITAWTAPGTDVLLRLIRAIAAAARAEPALNAWFDPQAEARRLHERVDLGIAVDTPTGLYVPVLRDAGGIGTPARRADLAALIDAARARRLTPADQADPTITLSNFGALGGRHAALVVSPPQVAILGAGRAFAGIGWQGDRPERRNSLPLSLTFDHRAVTGGEAARFLAAVIADLEQPE
ncbi:MAG TPA: dihydrolipoamide acetyltransferase family protein [Paracoccaceae bacterium]